MSEETIRKLREKTQLIVKKNGEYLQCLDCNWQLRWTTSPYDAWATRSVDDAQMVADKVEGELFLFNPIVGSLKKYKE